MGIKIGPIETKGRVFLAPMSGITDVAFRSLAHELGAPVVVSEMVASKELVRQRRDMVRRAASPDGIWPRVMQLAGREAHWMAEGAKVARDAGAGIIDINMGCPARMVTGGQSGSALMRDLDHAEALIAATCNATSLPVTVKMRLGWDHSTLNAPELARRAEQNGAAMVFVHGRTRCQFYKGRADWRAIARVVDAVSIPVIANGDVRTIADVHQILAQSGASGVMTGRGAYGRPWLPGVLAGLLDEGCGIAAPSLNAQLDIAKDHYSRILSFYGAAQGLKIARKHLGWIIANFVDDGLLDAHGAGRWRARLMREDDHGKVPRALDELYDSVGASACEAA